MAKNNPKKTTFANAGFDSAVVFHYADNHYPVVVENLNGITLRSFNHEKIKIIIVGTFTPFEGRQRCMFYSSDANNLYEFIDDELPGLKELLDKEESGGPAEKRIIELLESKGIAFLDVIAYAAYDNEKKFDSAADSDIGCFCLDRDSFKHFLGKGIRFIANSRAAQTGFQRIVSYLGFKDTCVYCPQTVRGRKPANCSTPKTKENLKLYWRNLLYGEKHT